MKEFLIGTVQSNIWKLGVIKALRWFMLIMPTIVLFFQENGLSMREVLLLQSLFSVAVIVLEIPSGYFSDVIGRKTTIFLACISGFLGFLIYVFAQDFSGFLIAELLLGLGSSFLSGTDSALLYDSLLELRREGEFTKLEGRLLAVGNFSEAAASLVGGALALVSLRLPFIVMAIVVFLSIPVALLLVEPKRRKFEAHDNPIKEVLRIVRFGLHEHAVIKWLIIYSGFVGASTLTMVWFIQPYLASGGLPLAYFGIAWAVLNASVGIFSLFAHRIEALVGRRTALLMLMPLIALAYLILSLSTAYWAFAFIFIFYFVRGISNPVLTDYVNRLTSSEMRATILSVKNLFGRIVFAIVGPFVGWVADIYSLPVAFITSGLIFLVLGLTSLCFLHKHKAN